MTTYRLKMVWSFTHFAWRQFFQNPVYGFTTVFCGPDKPADDDSGEGLVTFRRAWAKNVFAFLPPVLESTPDMGTALCSPALCGRHLGRVLLANTHRGRECFNNPVPTCRSHNACGGRDAEKRMKGNLIMTRKFKKRLLALVLTLALCITMMLPGAAAVRPTNSEEHTHVWSTTGTSTITYAYENPTYHIATTTDAYPCKYCSAVQKAIRTRRETHNSGNYCTLCRRYINMSLPGEIMGVDHEDAC